MQSEAPMKILRSSFPLQLLSGEPAADAVQARRAMTLLDNLIVKCVGVGRIQQLQMIIGILQIGARGQRCHHVDRDNNGKEANGK